MSPKAPLNGVKTHPLSAHALDVLRDLARRGAVPRQEINPGVNNRFEREGLVEEVMLPSPYRTHKGAKIAHAQITDAGRSRLAEIDHGTHKE